jgi:beta-xylosidase
MWFGEKPVLGDPETVLAASDSFDSSTLKPEWEWNYQPRAGMWSLKERPGYLRLRAFEPLRLGDFKAVGDVITQRAFRTRRNQATIKMDLSGMAEGQEAGLAHFARTYGTIGIVQQAGSRRLVFHNDGITLLGPEVDGVVIYLRSTWGFDGDSQFWYSSDGVTYHPFGERYDLTWGAYRGDRIGIYTFSGTRRSGYVDIDSFTYRIEH